MRSFPIAILLALAFSSSAHAIILSTKTTRNTSAPAGVLLNSGWQWEGQWNGFLGTAISKNTFITAGHIGGTVGSYFKLNGVNYKTVATFNDPQSDLQIWSVHGRLPTAAPLFAQSSEVGRGVVLYGRGTQTGAPIVVNNQTKGWLWGASDGVQSWGKNIITGTANGQSDASTGSHAVSGSLIDFAFDRTGWSHEGTLSVGDSGGGVFTKVGTTWQLVGVNFSVESEFKIPGDSTQYNGALVDKGGLIIDNALVADALADNPSLAYATRISARLGWITDVLSGRVAPTSTTPGTTGVPEPTALTPLILLACTMIRRRRKSG